MVKKACTNCLGRGTITHDGVDTVCPLCRGQCFVVLPAKPIRIKPEVKR